MGHIQVLSFRKNFLHPPRLRLALIIVASKGPALSFGPKLPEERPGLLDFDRTSNPETDIISRKLWRGRQYSQPQIVTPAVLRTLKALIPLAPDHLPQEIEAIEVLHRLRPNLKQAVCFDTAFHRTMPRTAQLYGLPVKLAEGRIIRYGFHGLSYEYIVEDLARLSGQQASRGRIIVAHFGNGASLAAIHDGKSADTTMGFTPAGGIPMSTRSGDLDPGVILISSAREEAHASSGG